MKESLILSLALLVSARAASAAGYDRYLWETPRVAHRNVASAAPLVEELEREVQRILGAGPLAPLRLSYADIPLEAYWLYYERGRIIGTLASAYPHLTHETQANIQTYVRRLMVDPIHAPYLPGIKGPTDGAVRALHGHPIAEGRYITHYGQTPTLHVLYGLWLYADRTGDWDALKPHWESIKTRYTQALATEPFLFGQMSAHIAVARIARKFQDAGLTRIAADALASDLDHGRDLARIVARLERTRFKHFQGPRNRGQFPGDCWIFLDACPEILRFLGDTQKAEVTRRVDQLKSRYPCWWLHQAPYFTRWTGDEGVGTTPELIGMIYPVQRWIQGTLPETLATYLRSAPVGIGDAYWIEALIQTIEAFGALEWAAVE